MLKDRPPAGIGVAPSHLAKEEVRLWDELVKTYRFDDAASLELLAVALEARARARTCREQVRAEGQTVRDDRGVLRAHPLLSVERSAQAAFLSAMRLLRLDLGCGAGGLK
jgi:hypothetical protein